MTALSKGAAASELAELRAENARLKAERGHLLGKLIYYANKDCSDCWSRCRECKGTGRLPIARQPVASGTEEPTQGEIDARSIAADALADNARLVSQLQRLYDAGACVQFADGQVGSLHPDGIAGSAAHVGWSDKAKAVDPEATVVAVPWVPKVGDEVRPISGAYKAGETGRVFAVRYYVRFAPGPDGQSVTAPFGPTAIEPAQPTASVVEPIDYAELRLQTDTRHGIPLGEVVREYLWPELARLMDEAVAQDPMMRAATVGMLLEAISDANQDGIPEPTLLKLGWHVERIAKGGGK